MRTLIDGNGDVQFGHFATPVDHINHGDYDLWTPMDRRSTWLQRRLGFNQFEFVGLLSADQVVGVAISSVGYVSVGFAYVHDRRQQRHAAVHRLMPLRMGARLVQTPETGTSTFSAPGLHTAISATQNTRHVQLRSKALSMDVTLSAQAQPPLRVCTKAGETGWAFTRKSSALQVEGTVTINGQPQDVSHMLGLHDWSAGFMRRETFWNWAASSSRLSDGRVVGLNLSCGVNETSFSENAVWVEGQCHPLPQVAFGYDRRNLDAPWEITSQNEQVSLQFTPALTAHQETINAWLVASNFRQIFGHYTGCITLPDGTNISLQDAPGFAERHFARW